MTGRVRERWERLCSLFRKRDLDREFDDEARSHIDLAAEDLVRQGMPSIEAQRLARVKFGAIEASKDAHRDSRGLPWLSGFWLDFKLGVRMLRKSWGLTAVGGLAIAVTIGLGASVFTIWNAFVGTTLPLDEGDRLVAIHAFDPVTRAVHRDDTPLPEFIRWGEALRSVKEMSAARWSPRSVITPNGLLGQMSVTEMTASGFQVARVRPLLGRPLLEEDARPGADPVVVIAHRVWQSAFSSDPAILGTRVQLDDTFHTVVGVMPPEFAFPYNDRIWTPLRMDRDQNRGVFVFARLAPGVALKSAQAEVATIGNADLHVRAVPYAYGLTDVYDNQWVGGLILFLVALLLVPPCANIAILVYARTVTRREEFTARYALGASRGRIVAQIFVEVLVLAAGAGIVGFLLARQFAWRLAQIVLPDMRTDSLPFWMEFSPSFSTVLCVAALAVLAAAIAGVVPALQATGTWRQSSVNAFANKGMGMQLGRTWTALLAVQVALSLAILPTAMEMTWGILRPNLVGPGFAVDEFLTAQLVMSGDRSRFGQLQGEVVRQMQAGPDVARVTVSSAVPMEEPGAGIEVETTGGPPTPDNVTVNRVDRVFFDVFDARLLAGRAFGGADFQPGSPTVIVNRSFVEDVELEGNPLGRRLRYTITNDRAADSEARIWYEIVGVVDDFPVSNYGATMYHPLASGHGHPVSLTLRAGSSWRLVSDRLREVVSALDPGLRVGRLRSLEEVYRQRASVMNMLGLVLGAVMLIVLLFSMAGMYTLMAFIVAQRWREIGLRSALGAQPLVLVAGIFGRALLPVLGGAVVGGVLALLIDSRIEVTLAGGRTIPGVVPACATLLIVVGGLALIGPARRALRIDPAVALRDS